MTPMPLAKMLSNFVFVIFYLLLFGCGEKKELSHAEFWEMAKEQAGASNFDVILPSEDFPPVDCTFYGEGCVYGMTIKVWGIVMYAIKFNTETDARRAAIKFDTYYTHNWIFDEMKREPVLVDFVVKVYGAKRAREERKYTVAKDTDVRSPSSIAVVGSKNERERSTISPYYSVSKVNKLADIEAMKEKRKRKNMQNSEGRSTKKSLMSLMDVFH